MSKFKRVDEHIYEYHHKNGTIKQTDLQNKDRESHWFDSRKAAHSSIFSWIFF